MDVKTFSDQLRNRMNEQIEAIDKEGEDEMASTAKIIKVIRESLIELKQFIHQYEFKDQEEEICFFKVEKPGFESEYLFHQWILEAQLDTAFYDLEETIKYYKKRSKSMQTFHTKNIEFYRYLKSSKTHSDDQYFVRENYHDSYDPNVDDRFSTGYDNKVALILAYDLFKDYMKNKINKASENETSGFTWTASKIDLVELIYALHAQQCIDHGKINVKELVVSLEKMFNVDLGDYYRTYLDLRIRKTGRTKFLDALRGSLNRRMEELDKNMLVK